MLYILMGEDDYSIHQSLEEIKKKAGDPTALAANTTVLDGKQVTVDRLENAAGTVPFLAEKRLVVIEGLLGRFEPEGKTRRKKAVRKNDRTEEYEPVAACLRSIPDFTDVVLVDGRIGGQNPLLRELSTVARVRSFPLLKEAGLRQWIERRVSAAGGTISTPAIDLLVRFVGGNLWIMASEVDKLMLFARGRRIEEGDVREVVSYAQDASIFAMVDAVLESRGGAAQGLLQQLLKQGVVPSHMLVMIARQVQMMVRVTEFKKQGKSRNEMQERMGLSSDFILRRVMEQADRYSLVRLSEVYHKLLEADLSIKTGRLDGELALDILVAELGQGAAPAAKK